MKVAITGGFGFIGRALDRALQDAGHESVPLSRRNGGGVDDEARLRAAFEGCEAVAHCAGINRDTREQSFEDVHVEGTRHVIAAARAAGVRRLVLTSYLRARPHPRSRYHDTKAQAEALVRDSGLSWVILRPGVVFGPGDHLLSHFEKAFAMLPVFALVGLRARRMRPLAIEDMTRVLLAATIEDRLEGRTWPVVGPEELSVREVVRRVAEACSRRPLVLPLPVLAHYPMAWAMERLMREPLASVSQIRMLSESMSEPHEALPTLPEDLLPRQDFSVPHLARALAPGAN